MWRSCSGVLPGVVGIAKFSAWKVLFGDLQSSESVAPQRIPAAEERRRTVGYYEREEITKIPLLSVFVRRSRGAFYIASTNSCWYGRHT